MPPRCRSNPRRGRSSRQAHEPRCNPTAGRMLHLGIVHNCRPAHRLRRIRRQRVERDPLDRDGVQAVLPARRAWGSPGGSLDGCGYVHPWTEPATTTNVADAAGTSTAWSRRAFHAGRRRRFEPLCSTPGRFTPTRPPEASCSSPCVHPRRKPAHSRSIIRASLGMTLGGSLVSAL